MTTATLNVFLGRLPLPWLDVVALLWFSIWWIVYVWYADYRSTLQPALRRQTDHFVREWIARMVERDNRMLDVNVMRNLTRSSQFFASTTMLILGALVALMGYAEKAAGVLAELPFTQQVSERVWELKILLLVLIFVYAFFKFSWSIRQFGLCSILVGATRKPPADAEEYAVHIDRITLIVNFANGNFNNGLRAYYFGVAALSWFLHPVLMIAMTTAVVYVLHQREYRSRTVQAMLDM
ncbi:MAG TPA: DUF599 domain-containing protein [Burkholderiales bacterium]|jgi:uncharacterized membrane protein|nr:DUF599 domain-containing protein [Burkholderiales bacterium]